MRNTTLSRLALLGLASVSSIAFAANTVKGEIRFDGRFTTSQKGSADTSIADSLEKPDSLFISRARLDMMGDVAKNWTYGIRLEQNEAENMQLGFDPGATSAQSAMPFVDELAIFNAFDAQLARAYVSWGGIEGIQISMGRIGVTDISADRLYYKPFIGSYPNNMAVGAIVNYGGDHAGFGVDGKAGPVGYSFSVWNQTNLRKLETLGTFTPDATTGTTLADFQSDVVASGIIAAGNFDTKSLRLGYAGRLSFANKMNATTSYGLGVGYNSAPMNMPIAVATLSTYGATNTNGAFGVATFNNLSNWAVDGCVAFGAFQLNLGYESQQLKFDSSQSYGTTSTSNAIFSQDGKANSFWVEGGYLFMGDSYKMDEGRGVLSGVKLRDGQAGLEFTVRYGFENRKNALALLNAVGFSDFSTKTSADPVVATTTALDLGSVVSVTSSDKYVLVCVDNTANPGVTGTQLGTSDEKCFEDKMTGWAVGLNYYLTENAVVKMEYEARSYKFNRIYSGSVDHDSLYSNSVNTLRLRADFSF